jgi:3',5'-cyclic-AMP phosphodiesterase
MVTILAQISDVHIGGPTPGSGERFSEAIAAINEMSRQPDLVVVTGDLTQSGAAGEWDEFFERVSRLRAPWEVIRGNHDDALGQAAGHRSRELDDLHLVLLDTATEEFAAGDAQWLDADLSAHAERRTVVAIHHPPFETGIWWMDCVGMRGADVLESVVRRHPQVCHVMSGHVHRPITTTWGGCLVTVCPSTSVAVAADLDPAHDPAETSEPPMIALHAYTATGVVSHVMAVGPVAERRSIASTAADFVERVRRQQESRTSEFADPAA